jgi:uncharacterized protein YjbI with pentapeptide repeats
MVVEVKDDVIAHKKEQLKFSFKRRIVGVVLASSGVLSASLFSFVAFLSVGLVLIQNYDFKSISEAGLSGLIGFALLIFIYVVATILPVFIGFRVFSGTTVAICAACFGFVSYFGFLLHLKDLSSPFLLVVLGILIGWIGEFISSVSIVLVYSFWKSTGVFLSIFFSGLSSAFFVKDMSVRQGVTSVDILLSFIGITLNLISVFIISRRAIREEKDFAWFREQAIFLSSFWNISFYKQDLTDQSLDDLDLSHVDFREAKIYHTSFRGARNLEFARLQGTILADLKVRKLLTISEESEPFDKNFSHLNLVGANLSNLNLAGTDFTGTNLANVDFSKSNLAGADFTNAQLFNTNFSDACLTEACICDWAINHQTRFENTKCDWVYLKRGKFGPLEKKPDFGEFRPGEFEKWIRQLQDTIDIILREQPNVRALIRAIEKVAHSSGGLDPSRFSIESKGENLYVARIGTTPEADKAELSNTIIVNYNSINELMIQGESNRLFLNPGGYMETQNQNISAGGNLDMSSGTRVNIKGDVTGSSITLGDLNGQVSNTIRDIEGDNQNLAEILGALQSAINNDQALSESQKLQAMEAVATLAEESQKPKEQRLPKICSMAMNALKGITSTLTDASKLADLLKTHLPNLIKLLGL